MNLKRKVIPIITASLLLAVSSGTAQARVCLDTDIVDSRISQLQSGMIYDQAAAIMACDGVAGAVYTDRLGFPTEPYTWSSQNKSLFAIFRSGYLLSTSRSGAPDAPGTGQMPTFATASNTLTIPALSVDGGAIYTGISVSLPPGGKWQLAALADATGVAINVPPAPTSTPALVTTFFTSGVISGYVGIVEGTFFVVGEGKNPWHTWRAKAGCKFTVQSTSTTSSAPATATGATPTSTPACTATPATVTADSLPASPYVGIYKVGDEYVLAPSGSPLTCGIELLI